MGKKSRGINPGRETWLEKGKKERKKERRDQRIDRLRER
jgi:hypothetical protein